MQYITHPQYPEIELEAPDTATKEQIDVKLRAFGQEYAQKATGAGGARKSVRQEMAAMPPTGVTPAMGMGPGEIAGPGGSQGPTAPDPTAALEAAGAWPAGYRETQQETQSAGYGLEGEIDPADPLARGIARHAPGAIGGVLGGLLAGPAGARVGQLAPQVGKLLPMLVKGLMGAGGYLAGEGAGAAITGEAPGAAVKEAAPYAVGGEALSGVLGGGVKAVKAIRKGGWLKKAISPEGHAAIDLLGMGGVRPAQVVEGTGLARAVDIGDSMSGGAMFGGGAMETAQKTQQTVLRGMVDDAIDVIGKRASPAEAGEAVRGALMAEKKTFHAVGDKVSKEISEAIGNRPITLGRTHAAMDRLLKTTPDPGATALLKRMEEITTEHMPFDEAQGVMKMLNRGSKTDPTGVSKQLSKALWQDMADAAAANPVAKAKWAELGDYWKKGYQQFNKDFVKKIIENPNVSAEEVTGLFLKGKSVAQIHDVRDLVGMETWKKVESHFAQELFNKALPEGDLAVRAAEEMASISGKALHRAVQKTYGPGTIKAVLGDEAAKNIEKLARVLETTQSKGVAAGRLFMQMGQAGAVAATAGGVAGILSGDVGTGVKVAATAGGIWIGGPLLLSKIMTSPKATQYLLEGVQAPVGSPEVARAVGRLSSYLAKIGVEQKRAKEEKATAEAPPYRAPWEE